MKGGKRACRGERTGQEYGRRMRDAPISPSISPSNALSSFTHPFFSLGLPLYSLCLHPSLRSSTSLHIYMGSLPIHQLISPDVFILSLAIHSWSWLACSNSDSSLSLSREPSCALSWVMCTGEEEGNVILFFFSEAFKTCVDPELLRSLLPLSSSPHFPKESQASNP